MDNNRVYVSGEVLEDFSIDHEAFNERFYKTTIAIKRGSGTVDTIPVIVPYKIIRFDSNIKGKMVEIDGQFRSRNVHTGEGNHLQLYIFASEIYLTESIEDKNEIYLNGYICKQPTIRTTPLGRTISDLLLAVNRDFGKSDYIPCIAWGMNANIVSNLEVGKPIVIFGRIQSREYLKENEIKTAYEVSISDIDI